MVQNITFPLVECVLNVSEGQDLVKIEKIQQLLHTDGRVYVLHTDIGREVNRTVITIVGEAQELFSSLRRVIDFASRNFNINKHDGIHPRLGILDVIPFIPIVNISFDALTQMVTEWTHKIASEFNLPVYYYGTLSKTKKNPPLSYFRHVLPQQTDLEIMPDVGPDTAHSLLGVSCVTVRDFMVAYNINVRTTNLEKTKKLAKKLIDQRKEDKKSDIPNISDVRFLAWYLADYNCCQISTNIYNIEEISMIELFRYVKREAAKVNLNVKGSELIGLCPAKGISRNDSIVEDIEELELNAISPFSKEDRILEYRMAQLKWG